MEGSFGKLLMQFQFGSGQYCLKSNCQETEWVAYVMCLTCGRLIKEDIGVMHNQFDCKSRLNGDFLKICMFAIVLVTGEILFYGYHLSLGTLSYVGSFAVHKDTLRYSFYDDHWKSFL
jgi:hypothetical protein